MFWRVVVYVSLQLLSGGLGGSLFGMIGALTGVSITALAWFLLDSFRGFQVMEWLRKGECRVPPVRGGLWGDMCDRAIRLTRALRRDTSDSETRLHEFLAAIQASPNGVVLLDPLGHIEWCNLTAAEHLGFDAKRDVGQLIGNLLRNPSFTAHYASQHFNRELVIEGRGSTATRPVSISLQLHPYGEGQKLLLSRDVTALEQAEAMRRDFVANVSHEIRTPLTVLAGFVETLQTLPLSEVERQNYLGMMATQSHRMQSLVSDLLTLSRLEGSPVPSAQEWSSLRSIMAHCADEATALSASLTHADNQPHQFEMQPAPAFEISGSSRELMSAFSNLISNAIRYTLPPGSVSVTWQKIDNGDHENWLKFSVQDSGPGIAPEHIPRLTERFYRIDRSRSRETGGTGLGLAIVKHVLQRHGAELKISSVLGQGSCFSILLPESRLRPEKLS